MAISLRIAGVTAIALGTALAGVYQLGRQNAAPSAEPAKLAQAQPALPEGHTPVAAAAPQREG